MLIRVGYYLSVAILSLVLCAKEATAQTIRYQDEAGNIYFVEKFSDVPDQYRNQVIPPSPPPYTNDKERRAWLKEQKKLAKDQAREAKHAAMGEQGKMGKPKSLVPSKKGNESEEELKQVQEVEIYVSPSCADCPKLERFLRQNKIKFKKYDIVKDQKAFERFDQLGAGSKLPVTKIGNRIIKGVQPDAILQAATQLKITKEEPSNVGRL